MDQEQLVQRVTAEVMKQLGKNSLVSTIEVATLPAPKVLAIFTGGSIGLEQSFIELKKLQALHYEVDVVLSITAETVIGSQRISEELGSNSTIITTQSPYPSALLRAANLIVVPVLTQNTAAKLAYTLADSLPATLVMQALQAGKPIVAAMNAADPQDGWRMQIGMGKGSPTLAEALRQNLRKIEGYGIELVAVEDLAASSQKIVERMLKKNVSQQHAEHTAALGGKRNIIDAEMIKKAASSGLKSIASSHGTIITPLARDVAQEYGIAFVEEIL